MSNVIIAMIVTTVLAVLLLGWFWGLLGTVLMILGGISFIGYKPKGKLEKFITDLGVDKEKE